MTTELAATLSGLLFWLIIITNLASNRFGYQTFGDVNSEADLQTIAGDTRTFTIGFVLILAEHFFIVALAIMLFVAFGQLTAVLGVAWLAFRSLEGLIQIANKRNYWRLNDLAAQYVAARDESQKQQIAKTRIEILNSKRSNFLSAQILFALGTLAYSIVFVSHDVLPALIGWGGIVAAVIYGVVSVTTLVKPALRVIWNIGGLLVLVFEVAVGAWLLFSLS